MQAAKPRILLVNHNQRNLELLVELIAKRGYETLSVKDLELFDQTLDHLDSKASLSAALLDITSFDQTVWTRCERLRAKKIPFLVISARQSSMLQQESTRHGARGVMIKPVLAKDLIGLLETLLKEAGQEP